MLTHMHSNPQRPTLKINWLNWLHWPNLVDQICVPLAHFFLLTEFCRIHMTYPNTKNGHSGETLCGVFYLGQGSITHLPISWITNYPNSCFNQQGYQKLASLGGIFTKLEISHLPPSPLYPMLYALHCPRFPSLVPSSIPMLLPLQQLERLSLQIQEGEFTSCNL